MTQEWFSPAEIALTPVRRSAPSAPGTTIGVGMIDSHSDGSGVSALTMNAPDSPNV